MATGSSRNWLVNVAAIVVAAGLVAGTVDAMIASKMSPAQASKGSRANALFAANTQSGPLGGKQVDYFLGPIKSRNIFNHGELVPDEEVPIDLNAVAGPPDACTVPIQVLSGIIASRDPSLSLITYSDTSVNPPLIGVAAVGDRIANQATLVSVTDEFDDETLKGVTSIELRRDDGRKEICRSDAGSAPTRAPLTGVAMAPAGGTPSGDGIKKVSDDKFEVSQSTIDSVMNGGLGTLAQDVRIVPYYEGGASKGFKMYSIKPGSLLAQIGLMNGDVVEKINGYDLNSPEKALQVYGLLKNEKNVSVDLNRNGQNKTISYSIH